jgi:hypothetical protein
MRDSSKTGAGAKVSTTAERRVKRRTLHVFPPCYSDRRTNGGAGDGRGRSGTRHWRIFSTVETPAMHTSFDQTLPQPSRWDQQGAEYVRSHMDWCARCSKRLVGLNPGLTAEHAFDLASDLSQDDNLRAMSPEAVAEDMHLVDLRIDR